MPRIRAVCMSIGGRKGWEGWFSMSREMVVPGMRSGFGCLCCLLGMWCLGLLGSLIWLARMLSWM